MSTSNRELFFEVTYYLVRLKNSYPQHLDNLWFISGKSVNKLLVMCVSVCYLVD